jgi:hypothetical protein
MKPYSDGQNIAPDTGMEQATGQFLLAFRRLHAGSIVVIAAVGADARSP